MPPIPLTRKRSHPDNSTAELKTVSHFKEDMMNTRSKIACYLFFMSVSAPMLAFAQSPNVASLLNKANQMNNQEQDEAKELRSKAGDNQALVTMADTLTQDHKANQAALEALAKQENVTLKSYKPNKAEQDRLDSLKGAQFNEAFLNASVRDHKEALSTFRKAKTEMAGDLNAKVYIDQTIPVLESHLKMAENLRHDNKVMGSSENPENNKSSN
jgi:predicted outer membrane protein